MLNFSKYPELQKLLDAARNVRQRIERKVAEVQGDSTRTQQARDALLRQLDSDGTDQLLGYKKQFLAEIERLKMAALDAAFSLVPTAQGGENERELRTRVRQAMMEASQITSDGAAVKAYAIAKEARDEIFAGALAHRAYLNGWRRITADYFGNDAQANQAIAEYELLANELAGAEGKLRMAALFSKANSGSTASWSSNAFPASQGG